VNSKPPSHIVAVAERDYHAMRDRVSEAVAGARLLVIGHGSEVEAFAEVYWTLSRTDPRVAAAMGAAAIVQLAMQARDGWTGV
jgi:hypothetical protein